jgi:hypothetical protein
MNPGKIDKSPPKRPLTPPAPVYSFIVEDFNNEVEMATVNFSVPDEVKAEFDKTFGDQNKSSIIAELMRRAVRERHLQIRRERLFRQLSSTRSSRASFSSDEVRRARAANRP